MKEKIKAPRRNFTNVLFLICLCMLGCASNEHSLRKLSHSELLERLENGSMDLHFAETKDSLGSPLSEELRKLLNSGELIKEYYVDNKNQIKEARVRLLQKEDRFSVIQLRSAMTFPIKDITLVDLDCENLQDSISNSVMRDQTSRSDKTDGKQIFQIDRMNRTLIVSILEKCGWESIDNAQINEIFLIVQHMESELMARYYPQFIAYYNEGFLSHLNYARMLDRLLMNNGFPQIYGTQVVGKSFYHIEDVENVNVRRNKLHLGSIESAALRNGFEFKIEDYIGK